MLARLLHESSRDTYVVDTIHAAGLFLALREERAQRRDEETRARAMGCAIRVRAGAARRAGGARVSLEVKLV